MPNRRDFLLMRAATKRSSTVSCERLYMRFLDSIDELTTSNLAESLEQELGALRTVHLTETAWLTREDFRGWLEPLLDNLRARGGTVVFEPIPR